MKGSKARYEHEVEKPAQAPKGHLEGGMGLHSAKGDADPIAYGQAGAAGCKSDQSKISGQMKQYGW